MSVSKLVMVVAKTTKGRQGAPGQGAHLERIQEGLDGLGLNPSGCAALSWGVVRAVNKNIESICLVPVAILVQAIAL